MMLQATCARITDDRRCSLTWGHRGRHVFVLESGQKVKAECPTPDKRAWHDEEGAIHAALGASKTHARPIRFYRCPCGLYHITSKVKTARPVDSEHGPHRGDAPEA